VLEGPAFRYLKGPAFRYLEGGDSQQQGGGVLSSTCFLCRDCSELPPLVKGSTRALSDLAASLCCIKARPSCFRNRTDVPNCLVVPVLADLLGPTPEQAVPDGGLEWECCTVRHWTTSCTILGFFRPECLCTRRCHIIVNILCVCTGCGAPAGTAKILKPVVHGMREFVLDSRSRVWHVARCKIPYISM